MISIIETNFDSTLTRGDVIVQSDHEDIHKAFDELRGPGARNDACKAATLKGMTDPRVNDNPTIFAVDADGKLVSDPANQKITNYRAKIPVIRRLV